MPPLATTPYLIQALTINDHQTTVIRLLLLLLLLVKSTPTPRHTISGAKVIGANSDLRVVGIDRAATSRLVPTVNRISVAVMTVGGIITLLLEDRLQITDQEKFSVVGGTGIVNITINLEQLATRIAHHLAVINRIEIRLEKVDRPGYGHEAVQWIRNGVEIKCIRIVHHLVEVSRIDLHLEEVHLALLLLDRVEEDLERVRKGIA